MFAAGLEGVKENLKVENSSEGVMVFNPAQ